MGKLTDATFSLAIQVEQQDCKFAVPGDKRNCAVARSGLRQLPIHDMQFYRNMAWVQFQQGGPWFRFKASKEALWLAQTLDKTCVASVPADGVTVELKPPRGVRALAYTRSEEFRQLRAQSRRTRKGHTPREYSRDALTLRPVEPV